MLKSISTEQNKNRKHLLCIISALALHILSMYFVDFLQNIVYMRYPSEIYILLKFVLRLFYLAVPICFMKAEKIKLEDIGITRNKLFQQVMVGVLIGIAEVAVIVGLIVLLGFKEQLGSPLYEEGWQYIVYFFYAIFAVGLFEEIFFRGYIYKELSDIIKSKCFVIMLSSLIFGACHFAGNGNFIQDVPQVLLATIAGIFYCVLREKIKSCTLISLIVMHGIHDFGIAFSAFILAE